MTLPLFLLRLLAFRLSNDYVIMLRIRTVKLSERNSD